MRSLATETKALHPHTANLLQVYCPNNKQALQEYRAGKPPAIFKLRKGASTYAEDRIENSNFKTLVLMTFHLHEGAPEIVKAWYEWYEKSRDGKQD